MERKNISEERRIFCTAGKGIEKRPKARSEQVKIYLKNVKVF